MYVPCFILQSKTNSYLPQKTYKLHLRKKIGEGSYGVIYEINKNYVLKLFRNSYADVNQPDESSQIIPFKNENREINFFLQYIKSKQSKSDFFIDVKTIGVILINLTIDNHLFKKNSFFMIMPECVSIHKLLNTWKTPLINNKNGIHIVLNIMKRIIDIQLLLYNQHKIYNLDIKLDNFMIESSKKLVIDNIINIDFGLIKSKNQHSYNLHYDYHYWPKGENIKLEKIPAYSLCVNGLEILFGKQEQDIYGKIKSQVEDQLSLLKNNHEIYNIFYNGLLLKVNLKQLLKLIVFYLDNQKIK